MTIIMKKIVLAVMLAAAASLGLKAQSEVNQFSLKPMVGVSSTEFLGLCRWCGAGVSGKQQILRVGHPDVCHGWRQDSGR